MANAFGYLHEFVMVVVGEYKRWRNFAAIPTLIHQRSEGNLVPVDSTHHLLTPLLLSIDVAVPHHCFVSIAGHARSQYGLLRQEAYARTIRTLPGRNAGIHQSR
ncbi:hypothetical protein D3C85_1503170 [compost metagenome]